MYVHMSAHLRRSASVCVSLLLAGLCKSMNVYLDNARRNLQRAMNTSYHSISEAAMIAGTLALSTGLELYSRLTGLKAPSLPDCQASSRSALCGTTTAGTAAATATAMEMAMATATTSVTATPTSASTEMAAASVAATPNGGAPKIQMVSVVCGFPKDIVMYPDSMRGQFGEDAWFKTSTEKADALGVADGVGGWRMYGIDPGHFSRFLMRSCERLAHTADFESTRPEQLLARAYCNLLEQKQPILGSCTACVLTLHRDSSTLYAANIGDSGLMVIRNGAVVCRSLEQQHHFNTPYQLAVPPPGQGMNVLTDGPECAALLEFAVKSGDIVVVATDGVFDNVSEHLLLQVLSNASGVTDPIKLQMYANSVALMARSLSFNSTHESPFTQNARRHNINAPGGKPDDITLLLASVF